MVITFIFKLFLKIFYHLRKCCLYIYIKKLDGKDTTILGSNLVEADLLATIIQVYVCILCTVLKILHNVMSVRHYLKEYFLLN